MRLPGEPFVELTKLTEYLLNESHPVGGSKARFFLEAGFDPSEPLDLGERLTELGRTGLVVDESETVHGIKYVVDGSIRSPRNLELRLRTVWIVEPGLESPRLITAHPI